MTAERAVDKIRTKAVLAFASRLEFQVGEATGKPYELSDAEMATISDGIYDIIGDTVAGYLNEQEG